MGEKLRFWLILLILLIIIPITVKPISAISGKTTLLAVAETEYGFEGRIAELDLEIKRGSGQVFISTYPFSQIDTQASTKFAKDIACKYVEKDCSRFDFYYTIQSTGAIIGGPSAGGAIAALTIALLQGKSLDGSTTMTGTINSGGVIGQVGGVRYKLDAAIEEGMKKILIPLGEGINNDGNITLNLFNYSEEKNVELIEVSDLDDVLFEFGVLKKRVSQANFEIDDSYLTVMELLARDLCDRSDKLKSLVENSTNLKTTSNEREFREANNTAESLINSSLDDFEEGNFYSAASRCFGANVQRSTMIYMLNDLIDFNIEVEKLRNVSNKLNEEIDSIEKMTITDLEAYMAVKERLSEGERFLQGFEEGREKSGLAYAKERIYSAFSWSTFLDNKGKRFKMDNDSLRNSCVSILNEVDEKYQYLSSLFPVVLGGVKESIDKASSHYNNSDFELCIFTASLAKANVNVMLSTLNVGQEYVDSLIEQKLSAAKKVIAKEAKKGMFPILGYSYYEYANTLRDSPYSALLYSEYALELSNLDIYFKRDSFNFSDLGFKEDVAIGVVLGFLFGVVVSVFLKKGRAREKKPDKPKKKVFRKKIRIRSSGSIQFRRL